MNDRERAAVGILGAGRLGQAMARTARRAGRPVLIANSGVNLIRLPDPT